MSTEEIRNAVLAAIHSIAPEVDLQQIRPDLPLRGQVDLDSMDWLNVIASLHEQLSIDIPESDYGRLSSLNSIVDFVASRQAETPGTPARARGQVEPGLPVTHYTVDGTLVTVRPIHREDSALEADFVHKLSTEARYKRFMATVADLPKAKLKYLTDVDQVRHVALVATVHSDGRQVLVGAVRYVVDPTGKVANSQSRSTTPGKGRDWRGS